MTSEKLTRKVIVRETSPISSLEISFSILHSHPNKTDAERKINTICIEYKPVESPRIGSPTIKRKICQCLAFKM